MARGRDGVQRARIEQRSAQLSSDWGYATACEKFGAQLVDSFPKFTKGPRVGKLKGCIAWVKCTEGGWVRDLRQGLPGVVRPGSSHWRLLAVQCPDSDPREHSLVAEWDRTAGVRVVQQPIDAVQMHKTYGADRRYA